MEDQDLKHQHQQQTFNQTEKIYTTPMTINASSLRSSKSCQIGTADSDTNCLIRNVGVLLLSMIAILVGVLYSTKPLDLTHLSITKIMIANASDAGLIFKSQRRFAVWMDIVT
jgi:hypothetical protein